jgi:hypothetical protein
MLSASPSKKNHAIILWWLAVTPFRRRAPDNSIHPAGFNPLHESAFEMEKND